MANKIRQSREYLNSTKGKYYSNFIFFALGILLLIIIRICLLDIPFDRDVGAYTYLGQLLLDGQKPYAYFYEMKPPGIFFSYAFLILIFGTSIKGINLALLFVSMLTVLFVALTGKELLDERSGVIAGLTYGFLALCAYVSGFAMVSEHLLVLFALGGIYFTLKGIRKDNNWLLILGGFLAGYSMTIKQSGLFFVAAGGGALLLYYLIPFSKEKISWKSLGAKVVGYGVAAMAPLLLCLISMLAIGVFDDFYYWIYEHPRAYLSSLSKEDGMSQFGKFANTILYSHSAFIIPGVIGLIAVFFSDIPLWKKLFFPLFFFLSFLTITPGLRFYGHYWIQWFPAIALCAGAAFYLFGKWLDKKKRKMSELVLFLVFTLLVGQNVWQNQEYYFTPDYTRVLNLIYGGNLFPETWEVSKFLKERMKPTDQLLVCGSEPQLYVYTDKRSPTRHAYMSFLTKNNENSKRWQKEAQKEIKSAKPEYLVFMINRYSWMIKGEGEDAIYKWAYTYARKNYTPIGYVERKGKTGAKYTWGEAAVNYEPQGNNYIIVYERN